MAPGFGLCRTYLKINMKMSVITDYAKFTSSMVSVGKSGVRHRKMFLVGASLLFLCISACDSELKHLLVTVPVTTATASTATLPSLTISPTSGPAGTLVTLSGMGYDLSTISKVMAGSVSMVIISKATSSAWIYN
jgi:hypothetical protein